MKMESGRTPKDISRLERPTTFLPLQKYKRSLPTASRSAFENERTFALPPPAGDARPASKLRRRQGARTYSIG